MPGEGSSPRVRGAALSSMTPLVDGGIIPACAGSRLCPLSSARQGRDHPRVCGEQLNLDEVREYIKGSSPRVRGAAGRTPMSSDSAGIIPACAGSSAAIPRTGSCRRDHPRVCGEQYKITQDLDNFEGSSPRVRGAGSRRLDTRPGGGIIPACAGSRRSRSGRQHTARDHPRVCGEQLFQKA